jgi:hypothetical protein
VANQAVQLGQDAVNKALGSVAKAIGIQEYYSIHIGALCEGNFDPSFNDKNAKPKVASCTPKFRTAQTDLSKKLDDDMQVGPFKFKLSDLGLVEGLQKALDLIPRALAAMAFFFLFAILALVLGLVLAVLTVVFEYVLQGAQKAVLLGSLGAMGFAWFMSLIGVIGLTAVAEKVKREVKENGGKFGLEAGTSPALYFLLWGSLVFSTAAFGMLFFVWWRTKGGKRGQADYAEKPNRTDSHGFSQEALN